MKKKLFALFCVFTLIANIPVLPAFAVKNDSIEFLKAFGLLSGLAEDKTAEDTVKRSELAVVASGILNWNETIPEYNEAFNDVSKSNPYKSYIKNAMDSGIMSAYENLFEPDRVAVYGEAVTVFVRLLGYDYIVQQEKGSKGIEGYMQTAVSYSLFGVKHDANEPLTYGMLDELFSSVLESEILQIESGGNVSLQNDEVSFMNKYMDIIIIEGIVSGNSKTNLNGTDVIDDNPVIIDGEICDAGNTDIGGCLGYRVKAYVTVGDDDDYTVVHYKTDSKNNVLELNGSKVISYDKTAKTVTYEVTNKSKTLKLSQYPDAVLNGVTVDPWGEEDICGIEGKVKFIDNDNDGRYDVIIIDSSETYVVSGVNRPEYTIYDKFNKAPLVLDPDEEIEYSMQNGIKPVAVSELKEWDVLTVRQSRNKTGKVYFDIEVSQNILSARVTGVDKGDDDVWITLGEQEYRLCNDLLKAIEDELFNMPAVGLDATFYIDAKNNIAWFTDNYMGGQNALDSYGYIIGGTKYSSDLSDEDEFFVKLCTSSGIINKFPLAKRVKIIDAENDINKSFKKLDFIKAPQLAPVNPGESLKRQLVIYKLNDAGEICEMTFAKIGCKNYGTDFAAAEMGVDKDNFSLDLVLNASSKRQEELFEVRNGKKEFFLASNDKTLVFKIPHPDSDGSFDEEKIRVEKPNVLPNNDDYIDAGGDETRNAYYGTEIYDFDAAHTPTVMVTYFYPTDTGYDSDRTWNDQTNFLIVTDVKMSLNADDEPITAVTGKWEGMEEFTFKPATDEANAALQKVRKGDIIRFISYDRETIVNAHIVFRSSDRPSDEPKLQRYAQTDEQGELREDYYNGGTTLYLNDGKTFTYWGEYQWSGGFYSSCFIGLGEVSAKVGSRILLDCSYEFEGNKQELPFEIYWYSQCTLLDLSSKKNITAKAITADDIAEGSRVFVHALNRNIRDIVVIKE
ncbi:MAG: S-layer homology domain-containing protein [Clostridia bacterium]|nr:S-layer homology domain-containing protein [Clostridia bacterium]